MTTELEAKVAAERFRLDHHLGVQPLGDLVALIEQATGIDVAVLDAGPDEHGLTVRDSDRGAVFIAVARTQRPMRQRSSLAHELAHVLFGDWSTVLDRRRSGRGPEEVRADAFARHLLIPLEGLVEFLGDHRKVSEATLSEVVQRFLVSPAIATIAMHQSKFITDAMKQEWKSLTTGKIAARHGWTDQYRALQVSSSLRRAPQRLLARAIEGYREHVLSIQAIARLRGLDVSAIDAELREAGVVPSEPRIGWANAADLPDVDVDLSELDGGVQEDTSG